MDDSNIESDFRGQHGRLLSIADLRLLIENLHQV